jgi:hypothetical protein
MQGRNAAPWRRNRVADYKLLRRMRGVSTAEEVGRVYLAWHAPSGRPTLLVAPCSPGQPAPSEECRLRVRTGSHPAPYVALEVEQAPQGGAPLTQLADSMGTLWLALKGVEQHTQAAEHLRTPPTPRKARTRPAAPARAALATVGVLGLLTLLGLPRLWRAEWATPAAEPAQEALAAAAQEALEEPEALPVGSMEGRAQPWVLALDMPPRPFRGQYRVDKDGKCKGRLEVPINGGCWVALDLKPPCGADAYEHGGKCYWPSMPAAKEPSSTLPHPPTLPAQHAR